ncbi:MAG: ATP-dependent DNA helicase RecG [Ignavibacteria bacterium]|nr:ATP-dependent DNA helicase RecG [Ignavibacteria bacterium]
MDLKFLKGVGEKRAEAFEKIGVMHVEDFLRFIPRTYLKRISVRECPAYIEENVVVTGEVIDISYPKKETQPLGIALRDNTGAVEIPMFGGSEFRSRQFRLGEKYSFWIKIDKDRQVSGLKISYRDHLKLTDDESEKKYQRFRYIPVYELSGVLKKTWIKPLLLSKIVYNAFTAVLKSNPSALDETVPESIIAKLRLPSRKDAVLRINFPAVSEDIETARRRLAFDELFYLEIALALKKMSLKLEKKGISFDKDVTGLHDKFISNLPFELTRAQRRAMSEILDDMRSDKCMNRLLQGDVGSGKTVVAVHAMLTAIGNGYQAAFMCPTEILAGQHFASLTKMLEPVGITVRLLIGGQKKKERTQILEEIKNGAVDIIVGTHALIQESVEFSSLGFVVIDEQHKFGVMQRAKLKEKGLNPDVLVMTATPIPRTLSLTFYGDLDVSVIDELPANRKKIKTALRHEKDKPSIYKFLREEISKGRQAYIVYPLIEESEKMDLKSAEQHYRILKSEVFPDLRVGMIHGRSDPEEKEKVTDEFRNGKINILVSTTVIEVGVDIPNATIMIVEDAQRFGLSQLHQLRGRVGRGAEQSYCILIASAFDDISQRRLGILCSTNDGFRIAEEDMEIRGPGDFFGIRQSGVLNFSCTDLTLDKDLLETARDEAFSIVEEDPQLRDPRHSMIRSAFENEKSGSLYFMAIA